MVWAAFVGKKRKAKLMNLGSVDRAYHQEYYYIKVSCGGS